MTPPGVTIGRVVTVVGWLALAAGGATGWLGFPVAGVMEVIAGAVAIHAGGVVRRRDRRRWRRGLPL